MPFPTLLLQILVVLIIVGLALWIIQQIPMDATIAKILRVVIVVLVALWLLSLVLGWLPWAAPGLFYYPNQVVTDEIIALAYFTIPVWLAFSARARKLAIRANGQTWIIILFVAFIFSCGFGHQIDAYYEWHGLCAAFSPFKTYWNWATAVLSMITAILIVPRSIDYMEAFSAPVDVMKLQQRITELERKLRDS